MQQTPRDLALAVLEWVVHATRPPRISELQEALAVEIGDTELDQGNMAVPETLPTFARGLSLSTSEVARFVPRTLPLHIS